MRGVVAGGLVCGLALLGFGGQARGADTIGSDLSNAADKSFSCFDQEASCTILDLSAQSNFRAPYDGVIVRWRVKSDGAGNSPVALQVVSWPENSISAVAASQPEELVDGVNTFATRLPIEAGQHIAIECCDDPGERIFSNGLLGQAFGQQEGPALVPGAPPVDAGVLLQLGQVLVNADIEADVDGDGYGDETQDECPTDASTQGECPPPPPPPQTTITKAPKKVVKTKGRRAQVTFAFTSSDADATFRCILDLGRPKECTSPFKTNVGRGKHKFQVRAETASSVDNSPAVVRFEVKRKRG